MPTVLVVEDSQEMQELISNLITHMGHEVVVAKNGLEAIKMAYRLNPALIILDLMMPLASGDLALGFLRSTDSLKSIPVIVTSAHPKAQNIAEALGAQACLKKPFELKELRAWIEKLTSAS